MGKWTDDKKNVRDDGRARKENGKKMGRGKVNTSEARKGRGGEDKKKRTEGAKKGSGFRRVGPVGKDVTKMLQECSQETVPVEFLLHTTKAITGKIRSFIVGVRGLGLQ